MSFSCINGIIQGQNGKLPLKFFWFSTVSELPKMFLYFKVDIFLLSIPIKIFCMNSIIFRFTFSEYFSLDIFFYRRKMKQMFFSLIPFFGIFRINFFTRINKDIKITFIMNMFTIL